MIYNEGDIIKRQDTQEGIYIKARVRTIVKEKLTRFLVKKS